MEMWDLKSANFVKVIYGRGGGVNFFSFLNSQIRRRESVPYQSNCCVTKHVNIKGISIVAKTGICK